MPGIFISYRRQDASGYAGRLFDRLVDRFGNGSVFMDVARIGAGDDFVQTLQSAVGACDLLLAVIGQAWLTCTDSSRRTRLSDPNDFLHMEIATALQRHIAVLMVVVDGATAPSTKELPEALKQMAGQALVLRDSHWEDDVRLLISTVEAQLAAAMPAPVPEGKRWRPGVRIKWLAGALGALIVAAALLFPTLRSGHRPSLSDAGHGQLLKPEITFRNNGKEVKAMVLLPGRRLAVASPAGMDILNLNTGEIDEVASGLGESLMSLIAMVGGPLVAGTRNGLIGIWNPLTLLREDRIDAHTAAVGALVQMDEARFASGSWDGKIHIWNVGTRKIETTLAGHTNQVRALAALPDRRLASASLDGTIRIWNLTAGRVKVTTLAGRGKGLNALVRLPDGQLASGSEDGTIEIWNLASGKAESALPLPHYLVNSLLPLKDDRIIVGSEDGSLSVWSIITHRCESTLVGHSKRVNALVLLPDGHLASGSDDGTIKLWDLGPTAH
jgi:hypothetical protein